jgi:hypothetical protein
MGWFDNLWRRRQGPAPETEGDEAEAQAGEVKPSSEEDEADLLEEEAFRNRTDEVIRQGRIPPGTG